MLRQLALSSSVLGDIGHLDKTDAAAVPPLAVSSSFPRYVPTTLPSPDTAAATTTTKMASAKTNYQDSEIGAKSADDDDDDATAYDDDDDEEEEISEENVFDDELFEDMHDDALDDDFEDDTKEAQEEYDDNNEYDDDGWESLSDDTDDSDDQKEEEEEPIGTTIVQRNCEYSYAEPGLPEGSRGYFRDSLYEERQERRKPIIKVPHPIFVLNLPKSGTESIHKYFDCGLGPYWSSHHWTKNSSGHQFRLGECMGRNLRGGRPLVDGCGSATVYTDAGAIWRVPPVDDNGAIRNSNIASSNITAPILKPRWDCFYPGVHGLEAIARDYP